MYACLSGIDPSKHDHFKRTLKWYAQNYKTVANQKPIGSSLIFSLCSLFFGYRTLKKEWLYAIFSGVEPSKIDYFRRPLK
jgi:DNA replicative helicase MCM subunit Mcm2 (Cdc46/Mcm family)